MLLNYLKVALRNIQRYRIFSFINIFGLASSMSVGMLIIMMVADQKGYDQFHLNKDRIYRVLTDKGKGKLLSAATSFPLAETLRKDYPAIETATHLHLGVGGDASFKGKTLELRGFFADAAFFQVFSYQLEKGNIDLALLAPHSMVITRATARQLFGDEDALGKTIEFSDRRLNILKGIGIESGAANWGNFTITGVINTEHAPSHLKFDVLVSSASMAVLIAEKKIGNPAGNWLDHNVGYTYTLLSPGKTKNDLEEALNDIVARQYTVIEDAKGLRLVAQSLNSVTPGIFVSSPPSFSLPIEAYYFLTLLALAILLSACLNYTNLSTARALTRAKEIGIRKVTGARRGSLIYQFLSESILTSLFALALAVGLLFLIRPAFKNLWINQYLNFDLESSMSVYLIFAVLAILVGIIAGAYPAFQLSSFNPIRALKNSDDRRTGKLRLQQILSASQFILSLLFITTSLVVYNQFKHHLHLEYGLNPKSIINVSILNSDYEKVVTELSSVPGVISVSGSDKIPGSGQGTNGVGLKKAGTQNPEQACDQYLVSANFIDNLEIELIAGKNLPDFSSDRQILVNEAAVKALSINSPTEIIGEIFQSSYGTEFEVVGVVKDFRFRMPTEQDKIAPLLLRYQPSQFRFAQLKISTTDMPSTLMALEAKWKKLDDVHAFKYQFYDEQLKATNKGFSDVISILGFIAILAITISCLGLLGMTTYIAERKKKEVGIRKVLGAGDWAIVKFLSSAFFRVLLIAVLIGAPISFLANNLWLQNFPNRVDFGWGTALFAISILMSLGLLTVGSQTLIASRRNPVDALKE